MYCPLCSAPLQAVEREEISLDYCPQCGGIWLDRGELDELVRREAVRALLAGHEQMGRARQYREFDCREGSAQYSEPWILNAAG